MLITATYVKEPQKLTVKIWEIVYYKSINHINNIAIEVY